MPVHAHKEEKPLGLLLLFLFCRVSHWVWSYLAASRHWWSFCLHWGYRFMWSYAWLLMLVLESDLQSWCLWRKGSYPLSYFSRPNPQLLNNYMHMAAAESPAGRCLLLPSWQRDSPLLPFHLEVIVCSSLTPPSPPTTGFRNALNLFQSSCPDYFKCLLHSVPNPYNNFSKRKDVQKEENKTHRTTLNSKAIRYYPLSIWVAINSRSHNDPHRPLRHLLDHSIFLSYQTFHKEKNFLLKTFF